VSAATVAIKFTYGIVCQLSYDINQSINQFICPEMQYTLDRTPREDATSANRCPWKQS